MGLAPRLLKLADFQVPLFGAGWLPLPKIARGIARIAIAALLVWGVVTAVRNSAQQLGEQRAALRQQAAELERLADEQGMESATLRSKAAELRRQERDYWKADWRFLLLSGAIYGISLLPAARFWQECLTALGQTVPMRTAFWAYFYGNLGKYIPGKAMVIVLRLSSLAPWNVRRLATTLTIFLETLTMMAVGSAMAAICFMLLNLDWRLTMLSAMAVVCMFLPTYPPLLRHLLVRLQPGIQPEELLEWAGRINWRLVARGWMWLGLTWLGFGLSLGCILQGLACTDLQSLSAWQFWLSSLAACASAVVLGFVSMVPGGAGVREVVVSLVLAPVVGPTAALSCALWLRITWLAVEMLMAAGFYFARFPVATDR